MNKLLYILTASLLVLTACKSNEMAYHLAYQKAIENDAQASAPAANNDKTATVTTAVKYQAETVKVVTGADDLKPYNVVCGSFGLKTNADALSKRVAAEGYNMHVVYNESARTYRVICASCETLEEARNALNEFREHFSSNQDFQASWLLYKR